MNYCQNCGSHLEGSGKFCPGCGCAVALSYENPSFNSTQGYSQNNPSLWNGQGQTRSFNTSPGINPNQNRGYNSPHESNQGQNQVYNFPPGTNPNQNRGYNSPHESNQGQYQSYNVPQGMDPGQSQPGFLNRLDDNTTMMSALAYVFFLIPLLTNAYKTSETVKFHTNQGLVLWIACAAWAIIRLIIATVLYTIPYFGWVAGSLLNLVWIGFAALFVVGIMNAVNDRMKPLPLIGRFTILK